MTELQKRRQTINGEAPEDCRVATITSSVLQGEVCPLDCRETEGEAGYGFVS
jgi:hypothetical protein